MVYRSRRSQEVNVSDPRSLRIQLARYSERRAELCGSKRCLGNEQRSGLPNYSASLLFIKKEKAAEPNDGKWPGDSGYKMAA